MRYVYTIKIFYLNESEPDWRNSADLWIHVPAIHHSLKNLQLPFKMNHFPTLFLYSHLALRHLVNTRLPASQTIEVVHSDAAVQKAS